MATDTSGSDLTHIFASVQSLLLAVGSLEAFLTDVAKLAAGVTSQTSCGITMQREGEPTTVASSDDRALGLDETQYAVGHGPCLHTLHTGETTALDDVQTDTRWPEYMAAARQRGLRSSLSLPLRLNGGNFGVMNLYSFDAQNSFTDSRRRRLETFAAQASGALQLAAQQVRDSQVRSHLEQALDSARSSTRPSASSWANNAAPRPRPSPCCDNSPRAATNACATSPPTSSSAPPANHPSRANPSKPEGRRAAPVPRIPVTLGSTRTRTRCETATLQWKSQFGLPVWASGRDAFHALKAGCSRPPLPTRRGLRPSYAGRSMREGPAQDEPPTSPRRLHD